MYTDNNNVLLTKYVMAYKIIYHTQSYGDSYFTQKYAKYPKVDATQLHTSF